MMSVLQYQRFSSMSSTLGPYSASFQQFWCHPHVLPRITLVFDERTCIPNSVLSPIHVLTKLLRTVFPTIVQLMDDRTNLVSEVPRDLQCLPMIWAMYAAEDVSTRLDIPILKVWAILEHPSIFTRGKADTASAACPSQPGNLSITSIIFASVIWDADEPCSRVVFHNVSPEHDPAFVLL